MPRYAPWTATFEDEIYRDENNRLIAERAINKTLHARGSKWAFSIEIAPSGPYGSWNVPGTLGCGVYAHKGRFKGYFTLGFKTLEEACACAGEPLYPIASKFDAVAALMARDGLSQAEIEAALTDEIPF